MTWSRLTFLFLLTLLWSCKNEKPVEDIISQISLAPKTAFNPEMYFNHFGVKDGLISSELLNVYNDKKGFTWIATGKGIVRFDGTEFQNYFSNIEEGLHLDGAGNFYEDNEGTFWVFSGNGYLSYYDPIKDDFIKKPTKLENGWSTENPIRIFEDKQSNFWLGGYGGLQYFDRKTDSISLYPIQKIRSMNWPHEEKVRFEVIQKDQEGNLWAGTRKFGLVKFDPISKTYDFIRDRPGYINITLDDWVTGIVPADSGRFWISDYNVGLILFDPKEEKVLETISFKAFAEGRSNIYIRDILKEGKLLILSTERSGLIIYDVANKNVIRQYTTETEPKLSGNLVKRSVIDSKGNLWMVGNALSIGSQSLYKFEKLSFPKTVSNQNVYDIASSQKGELLVSTPSHTIFYDPVENATSSHSYLGPLSTQNYGVLIGQDGRKFTSDEHQIIEIDPKANTIIKQFDTNLLVDSAGNTLRRATRFLEDSEGTIWTKDHWGRLKFITKVRIGNIFALAQDPETQKFINVLCFIDDPQNKQILVGTDLGIASVKYGSHKVQWHKLLANETDLSKSNCSYLYRDLKGEIWGLIEGRLYQLNIKNQSASAFIDIPKLEAVKWIVEEPRGTYWLNTNKGILRFLEDGKHTTNFENHNFSEGSTQRPSPVAVADHKIFFGGDEGVSIIDPEKLSINPNAPELSITHLSFPFETANGSIKDTAINIVEQKQIELSYFQNDLIFSYKGIEYKNPKSNTYAFFLEGYDIDWINVGSQTDAIYTNISPGTYQFKVNAANSDGVWTAQPTSLTIVINPPWWKTWWAYLLYFILFAAAIYGWIKFQVYQKTLRYKINEGLRTKISSDLHDEVGTILSGLAMKSELMSFTANEIDQQELTSISDMSKDAMERMRDTVWAIDSRKDKYENLFDKMKEYAQDNLSLKNIAYQFNISKLDSSAFISPEKRQNTYLIFKEAVANILKHSDATQVKIDAVLNGDQFQLSIVDNGNPQQEKVSAGQGTSNMQMRAEQMGGQLKTSNVKGFSILLSYPVS